MNVFCSNVKSSSVDSILGLSKVNMAPPSWLRLKTKRFHIEPLTEIDFKSYDQLKIASRYTLELKLLFGQDSI